MGRNVKTLLILAIFTCLPARAGLAQTWEWVNPLPQGNTLHDIHMFDVQTAIAIGEAGTVIKTYDGGESWEVQHFVAGRDRSLFNSTFFVDDDTGFLVGEKGLLMRTSDGGQTWLVKKIETEETLNDVFFAHPDTGYIVGTGGLVLKTTDGGDVWSPLNSGTEFELGHAFFANPYTGIVTSKGAGFILRTSDGGQTWDLKHLVPLTNPMAAYMLDEQTVIAVGGAIVRSSDGGETWTVVHELSNSLLGLLDVDFLNEIGLAVGVAGLIVRTEDSGRTWEELSSYQTSAIGTLRSTSFTPNSSSAMIAGYGGRLMRSEDAGQSWILKSGEVNNQLRALDFVDTKTGLIVGEGGKFLRTNDGGSRWTTLHDFATVSFNAVFFLDSSDVYAVGARGNIANSHDGGLNWIIQNTEYGHLYDVFFPVRELGIAVGSDALLRTVNGGQNWQNVELTELGSDFNLYSVFFTDDMTGYIPAGRVLQTIDGGLNWDFITDEIIGYEDIHFTSVDTGYMIADDGLVAKTVDGGFTWKKKEIEPQRRFEALHFLNGQIGNIVGEDGLIFRTDDGGETWTEESCDCTLNYLFDVFVLNEETALAVGEHGTILARRNDDVVSVKPSSDLALTPRYFALEQNYPNPFNPETTIEFEIAKASRVRLVIYNLFGQIVNVLLDEWKSQGRYRVVWNGQDMNDKKIASGVYFYQLDLEGGESLVRKMLLIN